MVLTAAGLSLLMRDSMGWVTVSGAGPPLAGENLRPLYSEGLWLAVMLMPRRAGLSGWRNLPPAWAIPV